MSPTDSATPEDPYEFDGKLPEDCYQAWVGKSVVVRESDTSSKYPRVVETGRSPRPRHYPSPREREARLGFMERMKELVSKASPVVVNVKEKKKGGTRFGLKPDPFDKLNCSPRMKQFLICEFRREKVLYNYLPEDQVKIAVIHRYKTHVRNSEAKKKCTESQKKVLKNVKIGQSISRKVGLYDEDETLKKDDQSNQEEDGDNREEDLIEEFDESSLVPPPGGSFSLQPPQSQLRSGASVLLKFCEDSDSPSISDSPKTGLTRPTPAGTKAENSPLRKVKLSASLLPNLLSSSPVTEDTDFRWDEGRGPTCAWCLQSTRLQLCSQCQTVGYCNPVCQRSSWPSHKMVCKRLRSATGTLRQKLISSMKTSKTVRDVRKVQFNSQPEFEPSQESEVKIGSDVAGRSSTPRPILKKVVVQQVTFSPPVLSLTDHLVLASRGDQEQRFDNLKERDTSLGRHGEERKAKKNLGNLFIEDTDTRVVDETEETTRPVTPPNDSSVVAVVRRESEERSHSGSRARARRPDTPHPGGEEGRQSLEQEDGLGGGMRPQTLIFNGIEDNSGEIDEACSSPDMFGSQEVEISVNINEEDPNVSGVNTEEDEKNTPVEANVNVEVTELEEEDDLGIEGNGEEMEQDGSECSGSSLGFFSPIGMEEQDNVQLLGVSGGKMFSTVEKSGEQVVREGEVAVELIEGEGSNVGSKEVAPGVAFGNNPEEDQLAGLFSDPEEMAEEYEEDILSSIM